MPSLNIPSARAAVSDNQGRMTTVWYTFFQQFVTEVLAFSSTGSESADELIGLVHSLKKPDPRIDELFARVEQIEKMRKRENLTEILNRLNELEMRVAKIKPCPDLKQKFDELEAMIMGA